MFRRKKKSLEEKEAKKGRGKGKFLVACGCFFFTFTSVLTAVGVTIAVAFSTNIYIPVASEAVDGFEKMAFNQKDVEEQQKVFADNVYETLKTLTSSDSASLWDLFNSQDLKKEDIPAGVNYSILFDIKAAESPRSFIYVDSKGKMLVDFDSKKTKSDEKMRLDIMGLSLTAETESVATDLDSDNPIQYIKVKNMPFTELIPTFAGEDIEGKWIKVDSKELEDYLYQDVLGAKTSLQDDFSNDYYDQDLKNLKNFLSSPDTLGKVSLENGKNFNGNRARCTSINWDEKAISKVKDKLVEEFDMTSYDEDSLGDIFDYITSAKLYFCQDRSNGHVYEVSFEINFDMADNLFGENDEKEYKGTFKTQFTLSDYGKNKNVEDIDDKDALDAVDLIDNIYQNYQDIYGDSIFDDSDDFVDSISGEATYYTLYTSSDCTGCSDIDTAINDYDVYTNYSLFTYKPEDYYYQTGLDAICTSEGKTDCVPPVLEIEVYNYDNGDTNKTYVWGSEAIIEYFKNLP